MVSGAEGYLLQAVNMALLVPLNINAERDVMSHGAGDHGIEEHLNVPECLAAPADEQTGILALNIEDDGVTRLKGARGIAPGNIDFDIGIDVHAAQQLREDIARVFSIRGEGRKGGVVGIVVAALPEAKANACIL